jgi:D-glycero-alpha-D-manno-heptose 1-phosphate guanylyltransferase
MKIYKNNTLFILAGGFGTRLRSVVSDVPKPLAPVGDNPFLFHQINNWHSQGINTFYFLLHHQSQMIIDYVNSLKKNPNFRSCTFYFLVETQPLGTGGSILNAINHYKIEGEIIITNADTCLDSGIREISEFENNCIAVVEVKNTNRFGTVEFNDENLILNFHEKSGINKSGFINAGLYKLNVNLFKTETLNTFSIETYLFPKLVENKQINAKIISTAFIDIGVPEDYYKFCSLNIKIKK